MLEINWIGPINVTPLDDPEAEDNRSVEEIEKGVPRGHSKRITLTDPNSGIKVNYDCAGDLAEMLGKALRRSNKALHYEIEEQIAQAKARALLGQNGGGSPMPGAEKLVQDIVRGAHDPRRAS